MGRAAASGLGLRRACPHVWTAEFAEVAGRGRFFAACALRSPLSIPSASAYDVVMDRRLELEIIHRLRQFTADQTSDADATHSYISVDEYRDEQRFAADQISIFRRSWLIAAHASEIPNAGDYLTVTLFGASLLLVRGGDGIVRVFQNVCRHRGARLITGTGCEKALVCPYHGWTYALDGKLAGIPHDWGFADIDRAAHGLVQLDSMVANGIIHVRFPECDQPFRRPAQSDIAYFLPDDVRPVCHYDRTIRANWKMTVEGSVEGYHIKRTHKDTIYPLFLDNVAIAHRIEDDLRVVVAKRTLRKLDEQDQASWALREHSNIVYYLAPNGILLVLGDHVAFFVMDVQSPTCTRMRSMLLVPRDDEREKYWMANEGLLRRTLDEDCALYEGIQAGFSSMVNEHVTFGRFERGPRLFHEILRDLRQRGTHERDATPRTFLAT